MPTATFQALPKQERASHARPGADVLGRKPGYVVDSKDRLPIVTEWTGMKDYENAPPSYEIFFEQYWSYTLWYIGQFNVPGDLIEEIAMEIIQRFIERDSIGVFDRGWDNRSKTGKSVFRTYYTHFMLSYIPGKKRNHMRVRRNELLLWDAEVGDESGTTWGDVNGPTTTIEDQTDLSLLADSIRRASSEDVAVVNTLIDLAMGSNKRLRKTEVAAELGINAKEADEVLKRFAVTVASVCRETAEVAG